MLHKMRLLAIGISIPLAAGAFERVAQAFELDAVVKVAPSRCLSSYPNVVTIEDGTYDNGITVRSIANVTIDFRGVTVRAQANSTSAKTMTTVRNFNNVCLLGGRHWGVQDPQVVPWTVGHNTYGAGMLFKEGAGAITVENAIIENSLQDGLTLAGNLASNTTFGMRGVYIKNTSDDGVQNDGGKKILFIEDSFVESKMGLSLRPGADSTTSSFGSHKIAIRNSLFNVICVADDRIDGSCGPGRSASQLFKWSQAAEDVTVDMSDSIVRYEARSGNGWSAMKFVPGTYRNVIFVWDPETPGLEYTGPAMPSGVTFTTDATVWARAKATWLSRHGCTADGYCTFPANGGGNLPAYLGCYADRSWPTPEDRDLAGYFFRSSAMTTELCASTCKSRGYDFAGTQYANECWCDNDYGRYGLATRCSMPCAGNTSQICGGSLANSVYRLP